MHVFSTVDAVGGVWTYALELARALPDVSFSLAQMGPRPSAAQRSEAARLANVRLFESDFALEWQGDPWRDVDEAAHWLSGLSRKLKPNLVHLNGFSHAVVDFGVPVVVVAHSCVPSWWRAVKGEAAPSEWGEYERRVGDGLRAASAIVAPTRAFGLEIARIYELKRPVETILNGCQARFSDDISPREPFVLAAGRAWDEAKNFAVLEAASARMCVRLAGDAGNFQAGQIHLLGQLPRDELDGLLLKAAIFAHPALYEPFGLGVLEAANAGCALVLSDIPTLRELWDGAALFCHPRNEGDWEQTLVFLLQNPDERAQLGAKARERAVRYNRSAFGQSYRALYERLSPTRQPKPLWARFKRNA